ncbi:flagellar biosynthesis regulator FlaF [Donghicola mangrovi]|uniref:Flagellar biosynthesis regulator FlaF n=1 Tax=Donghicola mangrovi TaxID=2729614 RepID=A0A850Q903_9RHOB|nr:flagellar biosynthesis regulator FlaF [Donghicola mangrovi]NVO22451.1 flagellar biosynthesis regulator FlaF [Donghicola mangrovi]
MAEKARLAYGAMDRGIQSPRDIEYKAFAKVTRGLKLAAESGKSQVSERAKALHENRQLWTILATDLAGNGNKLQPTLRADLLSLAAFAIKQSSLAIKDPSLLAGLIEVNTNIMRGLGAQK